MKFKETVLDVTGPLRVERLPCGRLSRLLFEYVIRTKDGEVISAPAGFVTDFASTPRILWSIVPPSGKYERAAVIHDFLCKKPGYPVTRRDLVFLELMKALGVPFCKRTMMYIGVAIHTSTKPLRARMFSRKR